ncbi:MAG: hypothetical protein AB3N13_08625 [Arenibacterium sp.]
MKLSEGALDFLADIISGDSGLSPKRTKPELADFFGNRSEWEPFGHGFPPRGEYVRERLDVFNESARMAGFIEKAFDFGPGGEEASEFAAGKFSELLLSDGYAMKRAFRPAVKYLDGYIPARSVFVAESIEG